MSIWSRLRSAFGKPSAHVETDDAAAVDDQQDASAEPQVPIMRVNRDSDVEAAARLRIQQVERALRGAGAGERDSEPPNAEPPWARGKNRPGRLPSGPGRPQDAAFVLTVVLNSELPNDAATLSACFDCAEWPKPAVRLIPLLRNGVAEPGYAAQVTAGERRAFVVYRQQPYEPAGGNGHIGMLIGGAEATQRVVSDEATLAPLCHALLSSQPDAVGVVWNREDKIFRARDEALGKLSQKAPEVPAPTSES